MYFSEIIKLQSENERKKSVERKRLTRNMLDWCRFRGVRIIRPRTCHDVNSATLSKG